MSLDIKESHDCVTALRSRFENMEKMMLILKEKLEEKHVDVLEKASTKIRRVDM